jgi:hypothetical protein
LQKSKQKKKRTSVNSGSNKPVNKEQYEIMTLTNTTPINEEPVTVPVHFNELSEVKLKYHLLVEELEEA